MTASCVSCSLLHIWGTTVLIYIYWYCLLLISTLSIREIGHLRLIYTSASNQWRHNVSVPLQSLCVNLQNLITTWWSDTANIECCSNQNDGVWALVVKVAVPCTWWCLDAYNVLFMIQQLKAFIVQSWSAKTTTDHSRSWCIMFDIQKHSVSELLFFIFVYYLQAFYTCSGHF